MSLEPSSARPASQQSLSRRLRSERLGVGSPGDMASRLGRVKLDMLSHRPASGERSTSTSTSTHRTRQPGSSGVGLRSRPQGGSTLVDTAPSTGDKRRVLPETATSPPVSELDSHSDGSSELDLGAGVASHLDADEAAEPFRRGRRSRVHEALGHSRQLAEQAEQLAEEAELFCAEERRARCARLLEGSPLDADHALERAWARQINARFDLLHAMRRAQHASVEDVDAPPPVDWASVGAHSTHR
jgi:hypothetical protein